MNRCATCRHWGKPGQQYSKAYELGRACAAVQVAGDYLPDASDLQPLPAHGAMVDGSWGEYADQLVTGPEFGCTSWTPSGVDAPLAPSKLHDVAVRKNEGRKAAIRQLQSRADTAGVPVADGKTFAQGQGD